VRHFLGFADDSDARVGRTACWRRLVIVGEHGVARVEGTAFWRSLLSVSCRRDECRRMRLLPG